MGKIQRSEQQLPSVSSETFIEPHSARKSKITEEERALATHGNKKYLGEFGGETKSNTVIKVPYYYVNFTRTCCRSRQSYSFLHGYIFINPLVRTLCRMLKHQPGPTGVHLKAAYESNRKPAY